MKNSILSVSLLLFTAFALNAQPGEFPKLTGPYLGQKPPGMTPQIFAPGIVSICLDELNSVFSPDRQEFYFCVRNMGASSLFVMKCADGVWGRPEPLPFAGSYNDIDVSLSPGGQQLFFCSNRPAAGGPPKEDHDIWMSERRGATWGPPIHLGDAVNFPREDFYPVVTKNKTLYFNSQRAGPGTNDIYMCRWVDGAYAPAEKLGTEINTDRREFDAFVSLDETFIIFSSERPGGVGYLDFRYFADPKQAGPTAIAALNFLADKHIRLGDTITMVNDKPTLQMTKDEFERIFRKHGNEISLVIEHSGEKNKAKLKLERII